MVDSCLDTYKFHSNCAFEIDRDPILHSSRVYFWLELSLHTRWRALGLVCCTTLRVWFLIRQMWVSNVRQHHAIDLLELDLCHLTENLKIKPKYSESGTKVLLQT